MHAGDDERFRRGPAGRERARAAAGGPGRASQRLDRAQAGRQEGLGLTFVRAAGGILVRDLDGDREVFLVHRPRYDDWTFPKGKALDGESDEECALREVAEETGFV